MMAMLSSGIPHLFFCFRIEFQPASINRRQYFKIPFKLDLSISRRGVLVSQSTQSLNQIFIFFAKGNSTINSLIEVRTCASEQVPDVSFTCRKSMPVFS